MVPDGDVPLRTDESVVESGRAESGGLDGMVSSQVESGSAEEDGILDLTSAQLQNLKEVELPETLTELDLTANRLTEVDERIGQLKVLNKLSLRQNLFEDAAVEPLTRWESLFGLQELVLRDNKLTKVPSVDPGVGSK